MGINRTRYNILKTHFRCPPANYLDIIKLFPLYDLNLTGWMDPWYLHILNYLAKRGAFYGEGYLQYTLSLLTRELSSLT